MARTRTPLGGKFPKFWHAAGETGDVCTKSNPKPDDAEERWTHADVKYAKNAINWECRNCGHRGSL